MSRSAPFKLLFGPYNPPAVRLGQIVHCTIRGDLEVVGISAGPIPWPLGRRPPKGRQRSLIVMGGLEEAIRLESAGAVVTVANHGGEAVKILTAGDQAPPFDVVFMDLQMPEMDGLTATRLLRQRE